MKKGLEAFGGVGCTLAFLLLLVWACMLLIVIDQAFLHRHTRKRDRRHRFVHPLPSHLARVMVCAAMGSAALLAAPQTPRQPTEQPHADPPLPERVTKLVEKVEKTPPGQPPISVSRLLEIMDVRNERRVNFRGRTTIVFDFVGRKDAKTHGLAEDASKKLQGTIWIDEADRQVAHLEATFIDNFHVAGGLLANVQRGSNFHFDQELVNGELWLPTGVEGTMQARVLLLKNLRRHSIERDYDYKRFKVGTQQAKDAEVAPAKRP